MVGFGAAGRDGDGDGIDGSAPGMPGRVDGVGTRFGIVGGGVPGGAEPDGTTDGFSHVGTSGVFPPCPPEDADVPIRLLPTS